MADLNLAHQALYVCCAAAIWRSLPQQDFFGQILDKLCGQGQGAANPNLAAANLVCRAWHAGIHQQLSRMVLEPLEALPPAAISGLSCFSGLACLAICYQERGAAVTERKQEHDRVAGSPEHA